tara:strand:+ start:811 stop:1095 length:285 start_codon:yes stop_codon:yes gene_type:complete
MIDFNMKAIADRVIVKQDVQLDTQTDSGIFLPKNEKERPNTGTVVVIGKGLEGSPITLKVDDRVIFNQNATTKLKFNNEDYLIMRESDVLALIK